MALHSEAEEYLYVEMPARSVCGTQLALETLF
jgi:hypothetical protein